MGTTQDKFDTENQAENNGSAQSHTVVQIHATMHRETPFHQRLNTATNSRNTEPNENFPGGTSGNLDRRSLGTAVIENNEKFDEISLEYENAEDFSRDLSVTLSSSISFSDTLADTSLKNNSNANYYYSFEKEEHLISVQEQLRGSACIPRQDNSEDYSSNSSTSSTADSDHDNSLYYTAEENEKTYLNL